MDDREKLVTMYEQGYTKAELAEHFGVTWRCVHKWVSRYEAVGGKMEALQEQSRAPHRSPNQTSREAVAQLLALKRRYPHLGPAKLVVILDPDAPPLMAASTAGEILKRHGLVRPRSRGRRGHSPVERPGIEVPGPGHSMTADHKGQFRLGNRCYCYALTIADPASRYIFAIEALRSTAGEEALPVFERVFREVGVPDQIITDNGCPFCTPSALGGLSALSVWWIKLGIRHIRIQPGKPQQNGIHERMHRTLKDETTKPPERSFAAQQRRFDRFREEFNQVRPHEALGQKPPSRFVRPYGRPLPRRLLVEYDSSMLVRSVRGNGEVKWRGELYFISEVLRGERVAFKQVSDESWEIYFGHQRLAEWSERTNKVTPIKPVGGRAPHQGEERAPRPSVGDITEQLSV